MPFFGTGTQLGILDFILLKVEMIGVEMKNHLYQSDDGKIHTCEGGQITNDRTTYVVWTVCGIDVPANQSFKSKKTITCEKCLKLKKMGKK